MDEQIKRKKGHPFFSRAYICKEVGILAKPTSELTLEEYARVAAVMIEGHKKYEVEEYTQQLQEYTDQVLSRYAAKNAQNSGKFLATFTRSSSYFRF